MWLLSNARRAVRKEQDLWEYSPLPLLDSMIAAPTPRAPKPTDRCAGEYLALSIKSEHPFVSEPTPLFHRFTVFWHFCHLIHLAGFKPFRTIRAVRGSKCNHPIDDTEWRSTSSMIFPN
jgi:hypothetical protein